MKAKNKFLFLGAAFGMTLALGIAAANMGGNPGVVKAEGESEDWIDAGWNASWEEDEVPYHQTVTISGDKKSASVDYKVKGSTYKCLAFNVAECFKTSSKVSFMMENTGSEDIKGKVSTQTTDDRKHSYGANTDGTTSENKYAQQDGKKIKTDLEWGGTEFTLYAGQSSLFEVWYNDEISNIAFFINTLGDNTDTHAGTFVLSELHYYSGNTLGNISVDLTGEGWATSDWEGKANEWGQNVSIYFWDDVVPANHGWGEYIKSATGEYVTFIPYNLGFAPTHMKAVRYDPWLAEEDWAASPWRDGEDEYGLWGQTQNMEFVHNSNIIVSGSYAQSSFVGYGYVQGKSSATSYVWGTLFDLDSVKLNAVTKHVEYFADTTVIQYEEFKVRIFDLYYGWSVCGFGIDATSWAENETNIKYNGEAPVTVRIYFDRNAGTVYINDPDKADADDWAVNFLGADCTETKSYWATSSSSYALLSDGAKALFLGAEHKDHTVDTSSMGYVIQAMQRYDYVLERYGTTSYPDFVGRVDANKVVPGSLSRINFTNISDSSALFVIVAVAGAVTVICVAFAFRKKKQK